MGRADGEEPHKSLPPARRGTSLDTNKAECESSAASSGRAFHRKTLLDLEGLTLLVLHGQPVLGGDVHVLPRPQAEVQLLQQGGEEEEDLPAADDLAQAAPLAQPEGQNLLTLCPADFCARGGQETLGPEG